MSGLYDAEFVGRLQRGVDRLVDGWGLSAGSEVSLLTVSENATFRILDPTSDRLIVARVHRPGYHTRDEIASELAWIEALRQEAIVETPAPIRRDNGDYIAHFDDRGQPRDVVAFEFMSGTEPGEDDDLVGGFRELGKISARLHRHSRRWQRPEAFTRKHWTFDTTIGRTPHWGPWRAALNLDGEGEQTLADTVEQLRKRTSDYGQGDARFGLIHADLRLANLLIDGDRLGVIDFDDCGFGWYVYDFAAAISFIEEEPYIGSLLEAWTDGYRQVTPLAEADAEMIPVLVMLRRIQLTAWLASHAETPTAEELGETFTAGTVRLARRFLDGQAPYGV